MVDEDDPQFDFGVDDEEFDPESIDIDAVKANADWPKATNDKIDPLDREATPFISDGKWYIWFDLEQMDWDTDSEDAPVGMVREEFGPETMEAYIETDRSRQELYADVVGFLTKWGVKAEVVS